METKLLIRVSEIVKALGVSKQTWYRWVKSGYAPKATICTGGFTAWLASDIEAFAAGHKKERVTV